MDKGPRNEWTLQTAVEQLERCEFECIAGPLVLNDAFMWLKQLAAKADGPLTAQIRKILALVLLVVAIGTSLVPAIARQNRGTLAFWVEITEREQALIWLLDRQFTDEAYLAAIGKKLKTVTVTRGTKERGSAIVLYASRETNRALANATEEEVSRFWGRVVGVVMGKIRARVAPNAVLVQEDSPERRQ